MGNKRKTPWLSAIVLLGSFTFGYNLHNFMHEMGHAITIWVQGGTVHGFVLHPFLACYAPSTYVPDHILLYAGGALIGGTSTVLFAIMAWRNRSPYMLPFVMACAGGLITTSRWMLLAPFSVSGTDYYFLITLGVPAVVIFLWGLLFLAVGVAVFILYLPLIGLSYRTSLYNYLMVIELGILPYQVAASMYNILTGEPDFSGLVSRVIWEAVILAIMACLMKWLCGRIRFLQRINSMRVRTTQAVAVWAGAVVLIVTMLLVSISRDMVK